MNNTMISIGKHITTNYQSFGLQNPRDLKLSRKSKNTKVDEDPSGQWLIMQSVRTVGDNSHKVPFGNLIATGVAAERFLTLVEFECKTRAPNSHQDFYWNQVRLFRDEVYNALAGLNRGGIVIPRYDWTGFDMEGDVLLTGAYGPQAGEIWVEVDPEKNSPIEDPLEDQDDPANKSIFLTYNVRWWRPI